MNMGLRNQNNKKIWQKVFHAYQKFLETIEKQICQKIFMFWWFTKIIETKKKKTYCAVTF